MSHGQSTDLANVTVRASADTQARLLERSLIFPAPPLPVLTISPGWTTCAGTLSVGGVGALVTFASPPLPVEWYGGGGDGDARA